MISLKSLKSHIKEQAASEFKRVQEKAMKVQESHEIKKKKIEESMVADLESKEQNRQQYLNEKKMRLRLTTHVSLYPHDHFQANANGLMKKISYKTHELGVAFSYKAVPGNNVSMVVSIIRLRRLKRYTRCWKRLKENCVSILQLTCNLLREDVTSSSTLCLKG